MVPLRLRDNIVSFHHLVDFVKDEADLAPDPIFSPERIKKERRKQQTGTVASTRYRRKQMPIPSHLARKDHPVR